jgi:hypothetical protein
MDFGLLKNLLIVYYHIKLKNKQNDFEFELYSEIKMTSTTRDGELTPLNFLT